MGKYRQALNCKQLLKVTAKYFEKITPEWVSHQNQKAFFQLLLMNSTYRMKNKREDFTIITDSECFVPVSLSKNVQNILFQSISLPREITFCIIHC